MENFFKVYQITTIQREQKNDLIADAVYKTE